MIASIETTLEPKIRFSTFVIHKAMSDTSIPVSEVESWLADNKRKEGTDAGAQLVANEAMSQDLLNRKKEQDDIKSRNIAKLKKILASGKLVTVNDIGVSSITIKNYIQNLRYHGWVIDKVGDAYKMIEQGK